jgi:hypothetical protein
MAATTYQTIVTLVVDGEPVTVQTLAVQTSRSLEWVIGFAEKHLRINRPDLRDADLTAEAWAAPVA